MTIETEGSIPIEIRKEAPPRPLVTRLWMNFERAIAIATVGVALLSLHPSSFRVGEIGGITLGLTAEPALDPNFLYLSAGLALSYSVAKGLRVGVRETLIRIHRAFPGV